MQAEQATVLSAGVHIDRPTAVGLAGRRLEAATTKCRLARMPSQAPKARYDRQTSAHLVPVVALDQIRRQARVALWVGPTRRRMWISWCCGTRGRCCVAKSRSRFCPGLIVRCWPGFGAAGAELAAAAADRVAAYGVALARRPGAAPLDLPPGSSSRSAADRTGLDSRARFDVVQWLTGDEADAASTVTSMRPPSVCRTASTSSTITRVCVR